MKLLFIPLAHGGLSHFIPLIALSKRFDDRYEKVFLLTDYLKQTVFARDIEVLDLNFSGTFMDEIKAFKHFGPDVVFDDMVTYTYFTSRIWDIPRVCIHRTGLFTSDGWQGRRHSGLRDIDELNAQLAYFHAFGEPDIPTHIIDYYRGDAQVVPGIPSLEVLPEELKGNSDYFFTGPLILDKDQAREETKQGVADFFEANRNRRVVYFTMGLIYQAGEGARRVIRELLKQGIAVVTNIDVRDSILPTLMEHFYYANFLPLHQVCQGVDLILHQCGNGIYHYPILYQKPAIIIGTSFYDRDEVGKVLADKKLAGFLDSAKLGEQLVPELLDLVVNYLEDPERYIDMAALRETRDAIEHTGKTFRPDRLIDFVQQAKK